MVHALEGMFAFALWDERRGRLLLARDRFGEKPLFVHERRRQDRLRLRADGAARGQAAAARALDPEAVDAFFVFGYVPGPKTIVRGVRQLPPGRCSPGSGRTAASRSVVVDAAAEPGRLHEPRRRAGRRGEPALHRFGPQSHDRRRPGRGLPPRRHRLTLVASAAATASSRRIKTFTVGYDVGYLR